MERTRICFEGGPLDGVTRPKTRPARSPLYRSIDGDVLSVVLGDRIRNGRSATTAAYMKAGTDTRDGTTTITYRYFTSIGTDEETSR